MPLVPSNPQVSFSAPVAEEPKRTPQDTMGWVESLTILPRLLNPVTTAQEINSHAALWDAATALENPVRNAWEFMTKPKFTADPAFNPHDQLQSDGLWDQYRDNFVDVRSQGEYDFVKQKITRETAARDTLSRAGFGGFIAASVAGMADPTSLMPLMAGGKGAIAVLRAMLLGTVAAGVAETPLQLNQETRTGAETALSIAGGTIFGGVLGGASVFLRRGAGQSVNDALERTANDMVDPPGGTYGSELADVEAELAALEAKYKAQRSNIVDNPQNDFKTLADISEQSLSDFAFEGSAAVRYNNEVFVGINHADALDRAIEKYGASAGQAIDAAPELHFGHVVNEGRLRSREAQNAERLRLSSELYDLRTNEARLRAGDEVDAELTTSLTKGAGIGADVVTRDAGSLKNMLGIGEKLARLAGPVTAAIGQRISPIGRQMMAQLSTAGLRLEKNVVLNAKGEIIGSVPSNEGGTVESIINARRAEVLDVRVKNDALYADYVFGAGTGPDMFRNTRASIAGLASIRHGTGPGRKLNRREFWEAVGDAMFNGDTHAIPQVAAAAKNQRTLYDNLLKEAQGLGIISKEIDLMGDLSFLNRIYDKQAIARDPNTFIDILTEHMEAQLRADFQRDYDGFTRVQGKDRQRLEDMDLPLAEARGQREDLAKELKALDSMENDDVGPMEDLISSYRSEAAKRAKAANKIDRDLAAGGKNASERSALIQERDRLRQERDDFRGEVTKLQEFGGDEMEARARRRAEIKFRMRSLNRNQYLVEEKHRKKFEQIEALEEQNIDTMHRAISSGHKALNAIDNISEDSAKSIEQAGKALDGVVDRWVNLGNRIDQLKEKHGEPGPGALGGEDGENAELLRIMNLTEKQDETLDRLLAAQENLRSLQNIDRVEGGVAEARAAVQEALDATVEKLSLLNDRRAKRAVRLEKSAEKFDAKAFGERRAETEARMKKRREDTEERLRLKGADDLDMETGTAKFHDHAREIAESAKTHIMRENMRLAGFDKMADARGTELARTLSVPSNKLLPGGFLRRDAESLLQAYANTLIPDIEIVRRLGPYAPDGDMNPWFRELTDEKNKVVRASQEAMEKAGATDEAIKKRNAEIHNEYTELHKNLEVVIKRLRHQWGVPNDPDVFMERGANVVMQLQALRLLGGVVVHSLSDVAKPIMRYGLSRTMRVGWGSMISNWKAIKISAAEARRMFIAVETLTADRANHLADLLQNNQARTKFENAVGWGTSKIGIVAGFAPWTDLMKTISFVSFNSKVMDSLELALLQTGNAAERKEAVEFLASLGWSSELQSRIWKQINEGGGEKINGVWVPQTERWTDKSAKRAFHSAANAESQASIVTPGVERPRFMDSSTGWRVITSLKSFAMASTSKTTMAALQQRDMAVLNGVFISLALGGLSMYLDSVIKGGKSYEDMQAWSPQEWINRAVDQSGLLGALSVGMQLTSDATAGFATGTTPPQQATKAIRDAVGAYSIGDPADQLVEGVVGPAAGLASLLSQAIASGKWSPAEIHRIRQLLPLQNVTYLRKLFDILENSVGGNR